MSWLSDGLARIGIPKTTQRQIVDQVAGPIAANIGRGGDTWAGIADSLKFRGKVALGYLTGGVGGAAGVGLDGFFKKAKNTAGTWADSIYSAITGNATAPTASDTSMASMGQPQRSQWATPLVLFGGAVALGLGAYYVIRRK